MLKHNSLKILFWLVLFVLWALPALAQDVDTAWVRRYDGGAIDIDHARNIALDGLGNVYVTGYSRVAGTGIDYATIKYSSDGTELWTSRYNGPVSGTDMVCAIAVDVSGNACVTGHSYGGGLSGFDFATVKYASSDGGQIWEKRYSGNGNYNDYARDIALDGSGNVYVTGYYYANPSYRIDYATLKYDASDGTLLWEKKYNGIGSGDDSACAIALDNSGNIYVTGRMYINSFVDGDYATIKYDPSSNPAPLWIRYYNGPASGQDYAYDIAVDNSGNVYVTGKSWGLHWDYATTKYASNGSPLWASRYNGTGNSEDFASAIAVDASGNVYVTGTSVGSGTDYDFATVKYGPSGNEVWVRRYNGPGNSRDEAFDLALDNYGNIYVTGYSHDVGGDWDYLTIKYTPDGTLAWEKRYKGPVLADAAYAIAVDNSGNVYVTGESQSNNYDYLTIKYWQNYSPNSFSLLSPPSGAFVPSPVSFDWEDATDPDPWDIVKYDLHISTSPVFHPDSTDIYEGLLTSDYSDDFGTGTYYWKVKAYDNHAEVWSTQTWSFTTVTSSGLVGYWKFDEGEGGTAYDVSGYENHGTLMNEPTWVDGLPLLGKALEFDGTDDYVEVSDAPSLDVNGSGITFMAWIYSPEFNEYGWIMGKGTSGSNIAWLTLARTNNYARYWIKSEGDHVEREVPDVLSTNIWQHVAVVYDGSYMRYYLNAVEKDNYPKTGNMDVNDQPMYIGLDGWYTHHYRGKIDEIKIYNRALSPEEIEAEFESGFVRGDANGDGIINVGDVVYLVTYLYKNGPAPNPLEAGDCNCDGIVNVGDIVYLVSYLYKGGPAPGC